MKPLPETEYPLMLRTDFSNEAVWGNICALIQKSVGLFGFRASVEFLNDTDYADITKDQLLKLIPKNYNHNVMIIVDQLAISQPEHPLLIVYLYARSGHEFRALPSQIQGIENNLSIANMDFEEFAESIDEDGIFRGFPKES
jgi:uncharacterized protein DUF6924